MTDGVFGVQPGGTVTYTIVVANEGASDGPRSIVRDSFPAACSYVGWTCSGSKGGTCGQATGVGAIDQRADLPAGGSVTYSAICRVSSSATGTLINTATVETGDDVLVEDNVPDNDTSTDTDFLDGRGVPVDVPAMGGAGLFVLTLAMTVLAVATLRRIS